MLGCDAAAVVVAVAEKLAIYTSCSLYQPHPQSVGLLGPEGEVRGLFRRCLIDEILIHLVALRGLQEVPPKDADPINRTTRILQNLARVIKTEFKRGPGNHMVIFTVDKMQGNKHTTAVVHARTGMRVRVLKVEMTAGQITRLGCQ
jgi:hypothetical protein